jgi:PHD/YefM family antitoxin component YafN of YafNO toxin-antitoxin module
MPIAVPVRALKDTASFCQTVRESDGAVIVTRNGYDEFVALTPERYHEYEMALRRQALYESVDSAERRLASGRGIAGRSALAEIRNRHGL